MRSCIQIETWSLVFAFISLLTTSLGSLICIAMFVHVDVLTANLVHEAEGKSSRDVWEGITSYALFIHVMLAGFLSILAVTFAFSVILTKGLISKNAHLVKVYFIYGVTTNTLSAISHISLFTTGSLFGILSFWTLLGCFLYGLILMMIQKTYLKLQNQSENIDSNQFCHKKLEEEKAIS